MSDRFTYTTDSEIGVPGYYRMNADGTIDPTVRYRWVDDAPEDPKDEIGHFEPHEKQYALVAPHPFVPAVSTEATPEPPARVVSMQAEAHPAAAAAPKPGLLGRMLGR